MLIYLKLGTHVGTLVVVLVLNLEKEVKGTRGNGSTGRVGRRGRGPFTDRTKDTDV